MDPKSLTTEELRHIFEPVRFKTRPWWHQLVTLAWLMDSDKRDRPSLWHDVGTGKSLTALYATHLWGCERTLVICPNSVVAKTWVPQIEEHTRLSHTVLQGTKAKRRQLLKKKTDIHIVNYEGLLPLFCERVPDLSPRRKSKTKAVLCQSLVSKAAYDCIIIDECHHVSSPDAITTLVCQALSKAAGHCIIMTGTPVSTTEANLWAEYWVLDDGLSLGRSYYSFLNSYFRKGWHDWKVTPSGKRRILDRVAAKTIRFSREECFDLPERIYQERQAAMTAEQRRLTADIVAGIKLQLDTGEVKGKGILQQAGKLAQVAGGFLILDGGGTTRLAKNPKLDELIDVLAEIDGKVIVYHEYVEEGRMIEEALADRRIGHAALRGEIPQRQQQLNYEAFKESPDCRVLVAHPRSGGEGLNLQEACVVVFYSNGYSGATIREQCEGRIWRAGQRNRCLFIDLILTGSVDERKLAVIGDRADMADAVLAYVRDWRG